MELGDSRVSRGLSPLSCCPRCPPSTLSWEWGLCKQNQTDPLRACKASLRTTPSSAQSSLGSSSPIPRAEGTGRAHGGPRGVGGTRRVGGRQGRLGGSVHSV